MPSAVTEPQGGVTKLTNCRLVRGDALVHGDLWVSSTTGKIIHSQSSFYDELLIPNNVIDVGGRIVSPGLIDVQLNGAYGFNFSTMPEEPAEYARQVKEVNRQLVRTGVTSYMPTLTSQKPELYQTVRSTSPSSPLQRRKREPTLDPPPNPGSNLVPYGLVPAVCETY